MVPRLKTSAWIQEQETSCEWDLCSSPSGVRKKLGQTLPVTHGAQHQENLENLEKGTAENDD